MIDTRRTVVGVGLGAWVVCSALAAALAAPIHEQAKVNAADAVNGDEFGTSVALSGDTAIVGALARNEAQGAAYAFVRTGTAWMQQARLFPDEGATGDRFGAAAAVSGDTAVVGAMGTKAFQGAVHVFTRTGSTWTQQAKLVADDAAADAYFGGSVALSGDTLVVGAFGVGGFEGRAYVFTRAGTTWTQQAKLVSIDCAARDYFGYSVGLSGDTAVVGAFGVNASQGAAYVFTRTGTTWTEQAKLVATDAGAADEFGNSVAVSGDTVVVGANHNVRQQGAAYVFTRSGTAWTQQAKLVAGDPVDNDLLGYSVAASGDTVLACANGKGAGYIFTRAGTAWTQQAKLVAAGAVDFGVSAALSGGTAVVGASGDDNAKGAAWFFAAIPFAGIASATPERLSPGTPVVVGGAGFGTKPKAWLEVPGTKIALKLAPGATDTQFTATVPSVRRVPAQLFTLKVLPKGAKVPFSFPGFTFPPLAFTGVSPRSAASGAPVTITGAFLGKAGRVTLGGKPCKVLAWRDTWIEVLVPAGLAGPVDLSIDNGANSLLSTAALTVAN